MADLRNTQLKVGRLKSIVQKLRTINTIPLIKDKVAKVINMEFSSLKDLEAVIMHDPSLAYTVITSSNSSYYAKSSKTADISQALMVLGFNTVKDIVKRVPAFQPETVTSEIKSLWVHSLEIAEASRDIASKAAGVSKEDAFLAGLLHDIGRIVFYQLFGESYWTSVADIKTPSELLAKEEEAFGEGHPRVGSWFLEGSLLPERVVMAVENHHSPFKALKYRELAAVISFAEHLVAVNADPSAGIEDGADIDQKRIFEVLKIKDTDMVQFMVGILTRKEKIAEFYNG